MDDREFINYFLTGSAIFLQCIEYTSETRDGAKTDIFPFQLYKRSTNNTRSTELFWLKFLSLFLYYLLKVETYRIQLYKIKCVCVCVGVCVWVCVGGWVGGCGSNHDSVLSKVILIVPDFINSLYKRKSV